MFYPWKIFPHCFIMSAEFYWFTKKSISGMKYWRLPLRRSSYLFLYYDISVEFYHLSSPQLFKNRSCEGSILYFITHYLAFPLKREKNHSKHEFINKIISLFTLDPVFSLRKCEFYQMINIDYILNWTLCIVRMMSLFGMHKKKITYKVHFVYSEVS